MHVPSAPSLYFTWHGLGRHPPHARPAAVLGPLYLTCTHPLEPLPQISSGLPGCLPACICTACLRATPSSSESSASCSVSWSPPSLPCLPTCLAFQPATTAGRGETRRCLPTCTKPLPELMSLRPVQRTLRATGSLVMVIKVTRSCRFILPPEVIRPSVRHPVMLCPSPDMTAPAGGRAACRAARPSVAERRIPRAPAFTTTRQTERDYTPRRRGSWAVTSNIHDPTMSFVASAFSSPATLPNCSFFQFS